MTNLDRDVEDIRAYYPGRPTTVGAAREYAARELEYVAADVLFIARYWVKTIGCQGRGDYSRVRAYMQAVKMIRSRAREVRE
jgi:hypothetical protein